MKTVLFCFAGNNKSIPGFNLKLHLTFQPSCSMQPPGQSSFGFSHKMSATWRRDKTQQAQRLSA